MNSQLNRRKFILYASASLSSSFLLKGCETHSLKVGDSKQTIQVGILHSLTGTMAISEKSVVDAEQLAIAEINAAGGVLGKPIEPIIEDGASDWPTFAAKARKLIAQSCGIRCNMRDNNVLKIYFIPALPRINKLNQRLTGYSKIKVKNFSEWVPIIFFPKRRIKLLKHS